MAVIGIATKRAPMQCQGYVALLGSDDQSWGWNLVDNNLLHNGEVNGNFPQCNNAPKYQVTACVDIRNELFYKKNLSSVFSKPVIISSVEQKRRYFVSQKMAQMLFGYQRSQK